MYQLLLEMPWLLDEGFVVDDDFAERAKMEEQTCPAPTPVPREVPACMRMQFNFFCFLFLDTYAV